MESGDGHKVSSEYKKHEKNKVCNVQLDLDLNLKSKNNSYQGTKEDLLSILFLIT